jgi:cytochrome b
VVSSSSPHLRVWDPLVRVVHWSMVACIAVAWLIAEAPVHDWAGYILLVLMALRVVWGFAGPQHARFASFVQRPIAILRYARLLLTGREPRHTGHNPLGGVMIVALLCTGLVTSISGFIYTTDAFWGVAWVERVHVISAELLLVLAAAHIAGVIFTSIRQRENLIAAMFHGRKRSAD